MANEITLVSESNPVFCTMQVQSTADRKVLYNAVTNPTAKVSDFINKNIQIANVHLERAEFNEDGVITDGVKTIIITPDGQGIIAHSNGIAKSLRNIFDIFGMPNEWDEPLEVCVRQIETPNGRYFNLEVI